MRSLECLEQEPDQRTVFRAFTDRVYRSFLRDIEFAPLGFLGSNDTYKRTGL